MSTEDHIRVDLGDAIVEIRAFDTTYFEILTREKRVADFVMQTFGAPVFTGAYGTSEDIPYDQGF